MMVKKRCIFYSFRPVCNALTAAAFIICRYSIDSALPAFPFLPVCSRKPTVLVSDVLMVLTVRRESDTVTFGTAFT